MSEEKQNQGTESDESKPARTEMVLSNGQRLSIPGVNGPFEVHVEPNEAGVFVAAIEVDGQKVWPRPAGEPLDIYAELGGGSIYAELGGSEGQEVTPSQAIALLVDAAPPELRSVAELVGSMLLGNAAEANRAALDVARGVDPVDWRETREEVEAMRWTCATCGESVLMEKGDDAYPDGWSFLYVVGDDGQDCRDFCQGCIDDLFLGSRDVVDEKEGKALLGLVDGWSQERKARKSPGNVS